MSHEAMPEPERIMREFFACVWDNCDKSAIPRLFPPTAKTFGILPDPDEALLGSEAFEQFHASIFRLVSNASAEVMHVASQGDEGLAIVRFRADQNDKPGERVDFCFSAWAKVKDGVVVEARNVIDFHTFLVQLGKTDATALPTALGMS